MSDPISYPTCPTCGSTGAKCKRDNGATATEWHRTRKNLPPVVLEESQPILTPAQALIATFIQPTDEPEMMLRQRRAVAMKNLPQLAELRAELEAVIRQQVEITRLGNGDYYDYNRPSWADVGKALGVSKQAAQSRYGSTN